MLFAMMHGTKDTLKCIMNEVNLNPKMQRQLLAFAEAGQSFPFVPKAVIQKPKVQQTISSATSSALKLPPRPIQRPKSVIEKLGFERDQYRPNPAKTRPPNAKQRLQNLMAYGQDVDEELRNIILADDDDAEEEKRPIDMFSEIVREIQERQDFLEDMMALGEGKKYLPEIQGQIALRIHELEKIDEQKAAEFKRKFVA